MSDKIQNETAAAEGESGPPQSARRLDNISLLEDLPADAMRGLEPKCRWLDFGAHQTVLDRDDNTQARWTKKHGGLFHCQRHGACHELSWR